MSQEARSAASSICPECGHGDGEHEFLCERGVEEIRERAYGSAASTDEQRLREMLASVYTPEGVEIWLAHAEKHGWLMEYRLQRAEQLVTGAFA